MWNRLFVIAVLMNAVTWQACENEALPGPVDCDADPVAVTLVSIVDSNCALKDGKIEVSTSGGSAPYTYAIGNNDQQATPVFEGLGAGVYEITARDKNGCSGAIEITVKNSDGMNISFTTTAAGGCDAAGGTVSVSAFDGTEPYQYRIADGDYSPNNTFTGLSRGVYNLTVSDASGCVVTQSIRIRSGISFSSSVKPIVEKSCAINDCHNGNQFPDFRVFKNIHDNAAQIKALTADGTMPQEGTLTQAEINMIACWVDDGALDN